ncbi:MAG: metallophosphoesterase [Planctomycetaceae bacterium]
MPAPRPLVRPLFDGPVDIVGDVHGEIAALRTLLRVLGYSERGEHPEARRLVFLGDLTDRGPDSPAVVALVRDLVEAEAAQCVLGNHDLNLLLGHEKYDNDWFFGRPFHAEDGALVPQVLADDRIRRETLAFFRTLPLVLVRDDLRVVHACWNAEMAEIARTATDVLDLFHEHADRIDASLAGRDLDKVDRELAHQNRNPVKVLTSGPERRIATPRFASGKLRNEERVQWWETYDERPLCVFGHYSLPLDVPRTGRAVCVDFGVGKRWTERLRADFDGTHRLKLAALRLPERRIVFDDGTQPPLP